MGLEPGQTAARSFSSSNVLASLASTAGIRGCRKKFKVAVIKAGFIEMRVIHLRQALKANGSGAFCDEFVEP